LLDNQVFEKIFSSFLGNCFLPHSGDQMVFSHILRPFWGESKNIKRIGVFKKLNPSDTLIAS
jgi:hypothetical protein